jgi:precorrin-4 methylase
MPRKFWPTNSLISVSPLKRASTPRSSQIVLMRPAHASKASSSDRTRVLSQSKSRVVIYMGCR